MPISAPGAPFDFPASCSLEGSVKAGRVALVGPDLADGQPTGDSDVVAGFARHAHVHHFGRGGRQLQAPGSRAEGWSRRVAAGGGAGCCWAGACGAGCWSAGAAAASCGACARTSVDVHSKARQSKPVREIFTYASTFEISRHRPARDHGCTGGSKPFNCGLLFYFASNQRHAAGNPRRADCGRNGTGVEFA